MTNNRKGKTQRQLVEDLIKAFESLKTNIPNGEIVEIKNSVDNIGKVQEEMKESLSDMKKRILDPEAGVIYKVNQVHKETFDGGKSRIDDAHNKIEDLKEWKSGVSKGLWATFIGVLTLMVKSVWGFFTGH